MLEFVKRKAYEMSFEDQKRFYAVLRKVIFEMREEAISKMDSLSPVIE